MALTQPFLMPSACREGKGDKTGEPLLEPDSALTGVLVSPASSGAVHAVSAQCWGWLSSEDAPGGPHWDMKGVSLNLLPGTQRAGALTSQFSHYANWSSVPSPSSIAPCLVAPGWGLAQDPSSGSSMDQVPVEGIARRGCNAHGARQKPIAFHSLPWHVAALWCFSKFMFHVYLSVEGKWYPGP